MKVAAVAALVAVAGCSGGSGSSGERPIAALAPAPASVYVGQVVTLSAADSFDPDYPDPAFPHGIAEFEWTLTRPDGSLAAMVYGTGGSAAFDTDVPGDYVAELVVVDLDGLSSTPASVNVSVLAVPGSGVGSAFFVTWDGATDLDLHFVNVTDGGDFGDPIYDCHPGNATPDWGVAGSGNDPAHAGDTPNIERVDFPAPLNFEFRIYVHHVSGDPASPAVYAASSGLVRHHADFDGLTNGLVWSAGTVTYPAGSEPMLVPEATTFPAP